LLQNVVTNVKTTITLAVFTPSTYATGIEQLLRYLAYAGFSSGAELLDVSTDSRLDMIPPHESVDELLFAASQGDLNNVLHLLGSGVPVDTADQEGYTALMAASRFNKSQIVSEVIARGASVDKAEKCNRTALMFAASSGSLAVIDILIGAAQT
jgi:ankyrin repeat protein